MRLTIDTYWPLLFLALIPYLWWVQRQTLTDLSPKHLKLSGVIRSAIVLLLALAMIQPVLYRSGDWLSVVYLLDVSQSVAPQAIQSAIRWIEETNAKGAPRHSRFIPFGANSVVFDSVEELKTVQVAGEQKNGSVDQSGTDIEDALDRAVRSFAPHHLKRLVLITDGNENSGKMMNMLTRLKQDGIHVFTMPSNSRTNRDVWVEAIMAPAQVTTEEMFPLEAHVYSQIETMGEVEIRYGDKSLGKRAAQLTKGLNRIAFEARVSEEATGPVTIEGEVTTSADPFPNNNRFRESIVVQGKPKILYVEGRRESAKYLQDALKIEGFSVDTIQPTSVPGSVELLDRYEAIILSDVARNNLSDQSMKSIATYVRDLGGGFILSGGENNYGEGGYSKTVIEEVLPVTFETKKEKPESVSMIVVLDKSGSMGGQKIELAKEATKAPLELLKETDRFGVVAFDYNFYWPVRLAPVNRGPMTQAISTIIAGGETNIYPALREAYIQLAGATTQIKHVILLSDGRSLPDDFQTLTTRMAEGKITVSTVAVGNGADRELLQNIANWGKGRAYYLEDATRVPQIFTEETQLATGNTLREESFKPLVKKSVEAFKGIDFNAAPPLLGYVATKSKDTSEVLLENGEDPILARWQYGLGKTAAFTSDLKDRWAVEWLRWNGYPKFWSQLVRETMRRREDDEFDFQVNRDGEDAKITINAIQKDGQFRNRLQSQVRIIAPDQSVAMVDIRQVGPGSYEASYPMTQKGSYVFRAVDETSGGPSRILAYSYPKEYHFYPPNTEVLRSISTETGGAFQPDAGAIFSPAGETTSLPTPLWPYFTASALILYILDVFLRRVRLFE